MAGTLQCDPGAETKRAGVSALRSEDQSRANRKKHNERRLKIEKPAEHKPIVQSPPKTNENDKKWPGGVKRNVYKYNYLSETDTDSEPDETRDNRTKKMIYKRGGSRDSSRYEDRSARERQNAEMQAVYCEALELCRRGAERE